MGHGHVTPNADGSKARCGGPAMCRECQRELGESVGGSLVDALKRIEELERRVRYLEALAAVQHGPLPELREADPRLTFAGVIGSEPD